MAAKAFMTNIFRRGKEVWESVLKGTAQKAKVPRSPHIVRKTEVAPVQNVVQYSSNLRQGALQHIWRGIVPKYYFNGTASKISRRFPWRRGGSALLLAFNTGLVMANGNEESLSRYVQNYVKNAPSEDTMFMQVQELSLDRFEFGRHIGQGCNAAVYEARFIDDVEEEELLDNQSVMSELSDNQSVTSVDSDLDSVAVLSSLEEEDEAPVLFHVEEDAMSVPVDISDTESDISILDLPNPHCVDIDIEYPQQTEPTDMSIKEELTNSLTRLESLISELSKEMENRFPENTSTTRPESPDEYMSIDSYNCNDTERKYDLAVKMMFNYGIASNTGAILRAMDREAVPAKLADTHEQMDTWQNGHKVRKKRLPPHPNIVDMWGLFVDHVPQLSDCLFNYPAALPARIHPDGIGRNMTMFLVMKKYPTTLKDYISVVNLSFRERLYLFAQLLEGVSHMTRHEIAHRDMKSDNILLDTNVLGPPQLVISDFGCCLADAKNGLCLPYSTDEIDKGGNSALMAPEISTAEPGLFSYLNYHKADLWGSGALAYEIFGCENPFYAQTKEGRLDSRTYNRNQLPPLPEDIPQAVKRLVSDILQRDPAKRPTARLASDVLHLLLWAPPHWLLPGNNWTTAQIKWWIITMATEVHFSKESTILALKKCFLENFNMNRLVQAFEYFDVTILNEEVYNIC